MFAVGNPCPGLVQVKNVAGLHQLMNLQQQYRYKQAKIAQIPSISKTLLTFTKMNDNINMDIIVNECL